MEHQKWLTDEQVAARYGIGRVTVWRWAKRGHFPQPRKIGPNTTRWSLTEILEHEKSMGAAHAHQ